MPHLKRLDELLQPIAEVQLKDGLVTPTHLMIPQPDRKKFPIATLDMSTPSEMLGMHFALIGNKTAHVELMREKALIVLTNSKQNPFLLVMHGSAFICN